jgi:hypothetical protein
MRIWLLVQVVVCASPAHEDLANLRTLVNDMQAQVRKTHGDVEAFGEMLRDAYRNRLITRDNFGAGKEYISIVTDFGAQLWGQLDLVSQTEVPTMSSTIAESLQMTSERIHGIMVKLAALVPDNTRLTNTRVFISGIGREWARMATRAKLCASLQKPVNNPVEKATIVLTAGYKIISLVTRSMNVLGGLGQSRAREQLMTQCKGLSVESMSPSQSLGFVRFARRLLVRVNRTLDDEETGLSDLIKEWAAVELIVSELVSEEEKEVQVQSEDSRVEPATTTAAPSPRVKVRKTPSVTKKSKRRALRSRSEKFVSTFDVIDELDEDVQQDEGDGTEEVNSTVEDDEVVNEGIEVSDESDFQLVVPKRRERQQKIWNEPGYIRVMKRRQVPALEFAKEDKVDEAVADDDEFVETDEAPPEKPIRKYFTRVVYRSDLKRRTPRDAIEQQPVANAPVEEVAPPACPLLRPVLDTVCNALTAEELNASASMERFAIWCQHGVETAPDDYALGLLESLRYQSIAISQMLENIRLECNLLGMHSQSFPSIVIVPPPPPQ